MCWHRFFLLAVLMTAAGCGPGDDAARTAEAPRGPESGDNELLVAAAADRAVVAEVNGVPIYDDCVVAQIQALGLSRRAALEQCIDFELLAQAAQQDGSAGDPEVTRTRKVEAVRRLLDSEVTAPVPDPDRIDRAALEDAYARFKKRIFMPEVRHLGHVLAEVPEDAPEDAGSEAEKQARALADEIYAAMADRRDLSYDEFFRTAQEVAGDRELGPRKKGEFQREVFKIIPRHPNINRAFSDAAFEIPAPGMVSPPVRSHLGWHVIFLDEIEPARNADVDQAADTLVDLLRRERYQAFVTALGKDVEVQVDEQALIDLQAAEDAMRFGSPSGSM